MLCLSYYFLYSLINKIRDKGRIVSAWKQGSKGWEREGVEDGGRSGPSIACTYE
jgi:hypothetical protein